MSVKSWTSILAALNFYFDSTENALQYLSTDAQELPFYVFISLLSLINKFLGRTVNDNERQ